MPTSCCNLLWVIWEHSGMCKPIPFRVIKHGWKIHGSTPARIRGWCSRFSFPVTPMESSYFSCLNRKITIFVACTRWKTQGTSLVCTSQRGLANRCSQRYFQHAMLDPRRVLYPIFWACVEAGIRRFHYWDILGCHIQTRMESPWWLHVVTHL